MSEAFKSIEQGLKEALAHVRGERMATVHPGDSITDGQMSRSRSPTTSPTINVIGGVPRAAAPAASAPRVVVWTVCAGMLPALTSAAA